jgi:VWFA-related protein
VKWLALGVTSAVLAAQTSTEEPVLLRSITKLVQFNVVVHDRDGRPADNLSAADFTVLENGRPQKIAFFSVERLGGAAYTGVKLPENVFSNKFGDRVGVPGSVTAILLDSLNTDWSNQAYARTQVIKFLEQLRPEDRIALYTLGRGLRVLHDYTTDAAALLKRLESHRGEVSHALEASQPAEPDASGGDDVLGPAVQSQEEALFYTRDRVQRTLQAIEVIAQHLAGVPGRKNLIWVSGAFPMIFGLDAESRTLPSSIESFADEVERTMRAVNQADVAIYPVDARGLMINPSFGADRLRAPPAWSAWQPQNIDTMRLMADRTGGRASYNTNDIQGAVRRAIEDSSITYTLAYYPSNAEPDDKFRSIRVRVSKGGFSVRHRKGYVAARDQKPDVKHVEAELRQALWSPLGLTAIGLNARVDAVEGSDQLHVVVQIDTATVTLEPGGDRWRGKIELAFVQKDTAGKHIAGVRDTLDMALTKDRYTAALKTGLLYRKQLARAAGAAHLKLAVYDTATGLAGTLAVLLDRVVVHEQPR